MRHGAAILVAALMLCGDASAYRGAGYPLPGPNTGSLGSRSVMWSGNTLMLVGSSGSTVNTPHAQFKTGNYTSTIVSLAWAKNYASTNGTGTGVLSLTDTSGSIKCSINIDCTTLTTHGTSSATCSASLASNTVYQFRTTTMCGGAGSFVYPTMFARVTTP